MSSSSWFERNKKVAIGVGVAAVVGAVAAGAYYLNKKSSRVSASSSSSDAQSHASLAMKHHKNGSHRESIQSWTAAIQQDSNNYKYYNNRAQSYMLVNEYEYALADADKAIALNGEAAGGYYTRGRAALKLERFEDAAASFTAALRQVDASKIASQAQAYLKTCEEKIKKIRDSRFPSVAGTKKTSPVNSQRVSPSNSNKVSPTTSPVAAKKHTEQVAHVASTILEHAKPPVVEPVKATLPTPAAAAATVTPTPSPAPAPAPATTTPSPIPSTTQPDLSNSSKITEFLTEQRRLQAEIEQKQKAVDVADKIVDQVTHYVHTDAIITTTSAPTVSVSTASNAAPSTTSTSTSTTSNTTTTTAPVQIPSIFTPTSQNNKAESPVSPVSESGSNSGIFERSAVYVPNDSSAQTPPNKQSRLSFMTPDLISDTTTIDAESAVPIEAFAAIATGTPLQTPPPVFRTISAENSASSNSNSTSTSKSNSMTSSPILLNKPLPKQAPATGPTNGPLNFASENPLDEM